MESFSACPPARIALVSILLVTGSCARRPPRRAFSLREPNGRADIGKVAERRSHTRPCIFPALYKASGRKILAYATRTRPAATSRPGDVVQTYDAGPPSGPVEIAQSSLFAPTGGCHENAHRGRSSAPLHLGDGC